MKDWHTVCELSSILPDTGVCARVGIAQVAVFRVGDEVYALGNTDPFSGANVLARGIIGCAGGVLKVASPMYKQSFALETGRCLDDDTVAVPTFPTRVRAGIVEVAAAQYRDAGVSRRVAQRGGPRG
ncbi:MAG TPA: nitrite reductase small subunit NirD [Kofleriaceae bacterium]|nr:nitrite reductase small subunit NirD [Kofleriaceae bacterium]